MNSDILSEIDTRLDTLSRSERRVGQWLLANSRRAVDLPINEIAAAAGVSDPTVIRFCRSLGMAGFREFKTHLIAALQRPQSYLHAAVSPQDAPADAALKVLENSIRALVDLRASIAQMPFEPALTALRQARQVVFMGLGASGCVAADACHKFFRLGLPCVTALDPQTILQQASIATDRDVHVCISHTGSRPDLNAAVETAVGRGATALAVTRQHSELARHATLTFDCRTPEDTNVFTPMSSRLAQLTVLDALQVALAIAIGPTAEANLRLTKEALLRPPGESPVH